MKKHVETRLKRVSTHLIPRRPAFILNIRKIFSSPVKPFSGFTVKPYNRRKINMPVVKHLLN